MADVPAPNYASFNTPAPDPLAMAAQYQQYQNAKSQNALIQQETQNQAAQNPGIVAQSQRQQIGAVSDQAANSMQLYANRNKLLGDLYEKTDSNGNPNVSQKDMSDAIIQHVADGSMSAMDGVNTMATFPKEDNPQANRAYLKLHIFQNQSNIDQLNTAAGQQGNRNIGDQLQSGVYNSAYEGGGFTPNTSATIGMSPEANASRVGMIDSNTGKPITAPQSSLVDRTGHAPNALVQQPSPINSGGNALAPDTGNRPAGWNSASDQGQVPNITPNAPRPASSIPGAVQSDYSPGQKESLLNSAGQGINLENQAQGVNDRKGILNNMGDLLNAGDFTSGKAAQAWRDVVKGLGIPDQSIASQEEFNKMAYMTAQQQFKTLGGTGTDSKLDSAMSTSPSTALSNLGNKGIIAMLKGNEDAIAVKNKEWQQYKNTTNPVTGQPNGVASYNNFTQQFNQQYDPRVFQAQYLAPADRAKFVQNMTPQELAQYKNDYNTADKNGWLK